MSEKISRQPFESPIASECNATHATLKYFQLLEAGIDVRPFLAEIEQNEALWLANISRQTKIAVQRETQAIYLRVADPAELIAGDARDVHESRYSNCAGCFPFAIGFLRRFADEVEGELARAMIVRLAPFGAVGLHKDNGSYYACRDRYHLVLRSRNGSELSAGDEQVLMREGELWWFDNKQSHEARNPSDDWRIHLIFDVRPTTSRIGYRGRSLTNGAASASASIHGRKIQLPSIAGGEAPRPGYARLSELIRQHAVVLAGERDIISRAGKTQSWLLDIRTVFLLDEALDLVTSEFWERFRKWAPCQIAGLEMGAVPLVGALIQKARHLGIEVNGLVVRKARNKNGLQKVIEGAMTDRPIIVVDDLFNSGSSLEKVRLAFADHGCDVAAAFVVVDFQANRGREWREKTGIKVESLFTLDEFGFNVSEATSRAPDLAHTFRIVWEFRSAGKPDLYNIVARSNPAVDEHHLYVGASTARFMALDVATGNPAWTFKTGRHNRKGISSSPAIHDKRVFFGAYDGNVYALNVHDGSAAWIAQVADYVGSSPVIAADLGMLFIGLEHEIPGRQGSLAALDLDTGHPVWEIPTQQYLHATPVYCPERGIVAVGTNDRDFFIAQARTGDVLWRRPLDGQVKMAPAISSRLGVVCVGAMDGGFYVLDLATGDIKAKAQADTGIYTTPLIVGDRAFYCSTDKRLYVMDLTNGRLVTTIATKARCFSSPVLIEGKIYFGNNAGAVFELDPVSLEITGQHQLPDRVVSAIAYSAKTGFFYAHTSDARVFAFTTSRDL